MIMNKAFVKTAMEKMYNVCSYVYQLTTKLAKIFPEAFFFLKKRGKGLPWIFVVEDADIKASKFKVRSLEQVKRILNS